MGGTIDVQSWPGGSRFTVTLPLAPIPIDARTEPAPDLTHNPRLQAAIEAQQPRHALLGPPLPRLNQDDVPAQLPPEEPTGALRVLVVDDDEVSRMVARGFLRQLGAEVSTAGDGREALEIALEQRFDLILMDRHMPGMDGLQTPAPCVNIPRPARCRSSRSPQPGRISGRSAWTPAWTTSSPNPSAAQVSWQFSRRQCPRGNSRSARLQQAREASAGRDGPGLAGAQGMDRPGVRDVAGATCDHLGHQHPICLK